MRDGGSYETATGVVKKVDTVRRFIILRDGRQIAIEDVYGIECDLFTMMES